MRLPFNIDFHTRLTIFQYCCGWLCSTTVFIFCNLWSRFQLNCGLCRHLWGLGNKQRVLSGYAVQRSWSWLTKPFAVECIHSSINASNWQSCAWPLLMQTDSRPIRYPAQNIQCAYFYVPPNIMTCVEVLVSNEFLRTLRLFKLRWKNVSFRHSAHNTPTL